MKRFIIAMAMLSAASTAALARDGHGDRDGQGDRDGNGGYRGAPGPVIGAGLPVLAIGVGYGIYWLTKRRRRVD